MSQRFIRCPHCGLPHDLLQVICPSTGKAIRSGKSEGRIPAAAPVQPSQPPPQRNFPSTIPPKGQSRDLFGKTIGGKYVVRAILGEGGMGTVFEAEHLTIGRSVAVKVLHPNQARKKDAVRRFHQEARAAGAIGHPNICEVYDLGTLDDGSPYLVMERLVGETLADRIGAEGGLPFDDVIDILVQVLSGLVAAHEKGIVHRDIKPENVFLTKRVGCPALCKLLDFGVSKMIAPLLGAKEDDLDLTRTGMVMGTPYYMSPEQARGDRNLDVRVDLYACGVIMYEALTGRRPFTAANYNALLLQILSAKPKPARDLRPALPNGFDAVLDKAMARNRDDRYRSAAEFQRDLQTLRDRHGAAQAVVVPDLLRSAAPAKASAQPVPRSPAKVDVRPPPRPREPTPSSVEIPITFSNDTPLSGENMPVDATQLDSHPHEAHPTPSDASEFEEYPTQVQISPFEEVRPEDAQTTQKRGPEFSRQLAQATRGTRDADPTARHAVSDTDATGRPAVLRGSRRGRPDPGDDQETIIKSRSAFPLPRRKPGRKPGASPDDTIKVEPEAAHMEGDPTQLMAPRAPKAPRR
ncbi:MAG TPA: serine/threonine-protein kinase [Polyangiaceae bacterium]